MKYFETLHIQLDKQGQAFYGGEFIQGNLFLRPKIPASIRLITLTLTGQEKVTMTVHEMVEVTYVDERGNLATRRESKPKTVTQTETILHTTMGLVLAPCIIAPFTTVAYPFCIQVPQSLMCPTYKDDLAEISYGLTARVETITESVSCVLPLSLLPAVITNSPIYMNKITQVIDEEIYSCCCFSQGSMRAEVALIKSAFHGGEMPMFCLDVTNNSKKKIKGFRFALLKVVNYSAQGNSDSSKTTVNSVEYAMVVNPAENKSLNDAAADIVPSNIAPTFRSRLIDVSYYICVTLRINGTFTSDKKVDFPCVIGTMSAVLAPPLQAPVHLLAEYNAPPIQPPMNMITPPHSPFQQSQPQSPTMYNQSYQGNGHPQGSAPPPYQSQMPDKPYAAQQQPYGAAPVEIQKSSPY